MYFASLLAQDSNKNAGSPVFSLLIFAVIPLAMYFLMIRPQKRRQREAAALRASIAVGDEVMTTSGLYGFVTAIEGDVTWIEVDDNVQIRVASAAIQRKVDTSTGDTATPSDDGSGKAPAIEAPKTAAEVIASADEPK